MAGEKFDNQEEQTVGSGKADGFSRCLLEGRRDRTIQWGNLNVQKRQELTEAHSWSRKMIEWKESKELGYLYLLDEKKGKTDGYRNRCFELGLSNEI